MPALPRLSRSIGTGPLGRSVIPDSEASRDYAFLIASAVVGCKRQDRLGLSRSSVPAWMVFGVGVCALVIRGLGDRRAVAMAEQQVGRRPGEKGEPVGGDPVGQGGQEGVAGVDAGQDQQAAQAGLHDAQAARGDGEQRDDARGGVGQQDQGRPRAGPGGAQGGQQAAVVEAEAAGGQQSRLPPFLPQYGPDRVAFGQQSLVQAVRGGTGRG